MSDDAPFRRDRSGRLVVRLHRAEVELLVSLAGELRQLLETPAPDDPVVARLFPRAYLDPTEEASELHWQALTGPSLLRERLDALAALAATLGRAPTRRDRVEVALGDEQVAQWLAVLNDARLALGTRLGVTDDGDDASSAPEGPEGAEAHASRVYGWLTHLQAELVDVLLGELPDTPDTPDTPS